MANTSSAKKAVRKIATRTEVNKARRSRIATFIRKAEEALAGGNKDNAVAAVRTAESEMMRAAGKGVVAKTTASRKISRLTVRAQAL